jgi:hypothetical protein
MDAKLNNPMNCSIWPIQLPKLLVFADSFRTYVGEEATNTYAAAACGIHTKTEGHSHWLTW